MQYVMTALCIRMPEVIWRWLNENIEQLLETVDAVAADVAESRSHLERLIRSVPDDTVAANGAGGIQDRIKVHTADFHRWIESDRRRRRWWPAVAAAIAVTADPGRPGASHRPPSDPPQSGPYTGPPACLTALETNFIKSKSSRSSPGTVRKPCLERRRPINIWCGRKHRDKPLVDFSLGCRRRVPA